MAERTTIDADFNAANRQIVSKIEIYFDATPTTVEGSDYIIDMDLLEEISAEDSNPLGAISSNELTFTLFNKDGRYNPANASGPYYGKIQKDIKIIPYLKPIDSVDILSWVKLGEYYVADWKADVTGTSADITAYDKTQAVLDVTSSVSVPVVFDVAWQQFYTTVFSAVGCPVTIDAGLTDLLPCGYIEGKPAEFLKALSIGAVTFCTTNRAGGLIVEKYKKARVLRATLTDADQVISASINASILRTFDGVELTYNVPQATDGVSLLEVKDLAIPTGTYTHSFTTFTKGPAKAISNVTVTGTSTNVKITNFTATPWGISVTTQNSGAATTGILTVYGTAIDFVSTMLSDDAASMLQVNNKYIQSASYAAAIKTVYNQFVACELPILKLRVRGNPLLALGDKIRVQSTKYNLDFTGIIIYNKLSYNGGLSCDMWLLNNSILEVS